MQPAEIQLLNTEALWSEAFPVIRELWPELQMASYVRRLESMSNKGYSLYGLRSAGVLVSVAGVQEIELLARGKILWLFDMATRQDQRGMGYGSQLIRFLREHATAHGYSRLLLHTSATRETTINFYRAQLGEPFGVVFRAITDAPYA